MILEGISLTFDFPKAESILKLLRFFEDLKFPEAEKPLKTQIWRDFRVLNNLMSLKRFEGFWWRGQSDVGVRFLRFLSFKSLFFFSFSSGETFFLV